MTGDAIDRFRRLAVFSSIRVPLDGDHEALTSVVTRPDLPGMAWWRSETTEWAAAPPPAEAIVGSRWYVDEERCRALIDASSSKPQSVPTEDIVPRGLSFEFNRHDLVRQQLLSVVAGAWTDKPQSSELAPQDKDTEEDSRAGWTAPEAAAVLDHAFLPHIVRPVLIQFAARVGMVTSEVHGKRANPPDSYLLVPAAVGSDGGGGWFNPESRAALRDVLESMLLLQDINDERLAASVQAQSGTVTLLRVFETEESFRPNVVFLPGSVDEIGQFEGEARYLARFLEFLDDLVTYTLWDITTDLEMYGDRALDFRLVARGAEEVINPLLLELADPSAAHVPRVQEAIDLVRTTLLQSGPEMMQIRDAIGAQRNRIAVHQQMVREMRISVGEQTPVGLKHVDETLHAPYFLRVQLLLGQALEMLVNVEQSRPVIEGTAAALAERREQSLARLVETAHRFNIVLLVLAGATTVDLLVHFNWDKTYGWVPPTFRAAVLSFLLVLVWWVWFERRRRSPRRSALLREVVAARGRLVAFLQANSLVVDAPPDGSATWEAYDLTQAEELADLWDTVDDLGRRVADRMNEAEGTLRERMLDFLVGKAYHWSLRALLIGERPFPISTRLPLVACVYHFRDGGNVMSDFEFRSAVSGYVPPGAIQRFKAWGCQEGPKASSAKELLELVRRSVADMRRGPET